jgi:excisionase family DNA binding protein
MEHELLTVNEAADYLRVQARTVRGWLREGLLPGIKVGPNRWRIEKEALDAFVNERRHGRGEK